MSDSEKPVNCNEKIIAQIQNVEDRKIDTADGASKAPTGLLAEFLSSVMLKDYQTAFKYCAQILSYEPNNSTARDFYPLILEKLEMISNEEYDRTSSDSSETYSTDSKSSGNSVNQEDNHSDDGRKFSSGDESYSSVDKNADTLSTTIDAEEKQIKSENMDVTESESYFTPPKVDSLKAIQLEENPQVKQNSKEDLQTKTTDSATLLSSKLLIHPTKTQILRYSSTITEEKKKQNRSKKQKQKEQETPTISHNQSSSRVLLYPTRTITFPKITPESKLTKTENPQKTESPQKPENPQKTESPQKIENSQKTENSSQKTN